MIISTRSRVRRTLRNTINFKEGYSEQERSYGLVLPVGEEYIGTYTNSYPTDNKFVHVSTNGLWVQKENETLFIPFLNIKHTTIVNGHDKHKVKEILVELIDGEERLVEINGGDDKFRDLYSFIRFLRRTIEDRYREHTSK